MKDNKLTIYSIFSAILVYIIIFKMVVLNKYIDLSLLINALFIFTITIVSFMILGYTRDKKSILRYSTIQTIVIYLILYYILIYIFGIFVGFVKGIYSLNIIDIFKNVYLVIPVIFLEELLRGILVQKSRKNYLRLIIITVLFVILDIIMEINYYNFESYENIFKFVALSLMPALASSALMTFISAKVGCLPNIVYRLLWQIPIFILPIFPDIGEYFECIIGILLPFLIFVQVNNLIEKSERLSKNKMATLKWYVIIPSIAILVALIVLVSGFFKYHMIAVGSNSMHPTINRGDAVILEKIKEDKIKDIQIGEVLVFRHENKIVLHRVVDIIYKDGKYYYKTKGDNNNAIDNFLTIEDDVVGIVRLRVPYIGYPTVYLNDLFTAN